MKERLPIFSALLPGGLFACWVVGLWLISSIPGENVPMPPIAFFDKVAHFGYFLAGGFLLAWLLRTLFHWTAWKLVIWVFAILATIAVLDELHQLYTPGRTGADLGDGLADAAGALVGAWCLNLFYVLTARPTRSETPTGD